MSQSSSHLRSLERRAWVTTVFFAANAAVSLLIAFPAASAWVLPADDGGLVAGLGVLLLVLLGSFVAFLMWLHKAAKNARLLRPEHAFTFTTGWTIGWWFVPIASLWKPFQVMHEIWHASEGPAERDADGYTRIVTWGKGAPALLATWWGAWVVSSIVDRVASRVDEPVFALDLFAGGLNLIAAVLAILVMRELTALQRAGFARMARAASVASDLGHVVGAEEQAP